MLDEAASDSTKSVRWFDPCLPSGVENTRTTGQRSGVPARRKQEDLTASTTSRPISQRQKFLKLSGSGVTKIWEGLPLNYEIN
jgi:hypothetical protein